ncbi:protein adenylyltransferase SelO [Paucibacter sp. M5-1]|uniref:protein adenylyltransferase SelO n=1 Tax=Paucibacter sp. M5-1 TaxID=3015998 RepID=UPI0022B8DCEF|nr:YdiU family protein [Paucibacter sp. M5-1]MCZ7882139.1 YdiU family protein [Paucibacter sp. M5-1]
MTITPLPSFPSFDNSYARELDGPAFYAAARPEAAPAPRLLYLNQALADELGLPPLAAEQAAALFSGNSLPAGAQPIAQAYAGHQFGGFSPSLGDGRALLIGELIDREGRRRDLAFKGSGRTPFSRNGDGRAAVGPMLRELLIGEAMQALGVPTTRALAVVATGTTVRREQPLPGAVLTRVAASHLRVGTFQYFSARGDIDSLRRLLVYALARHDAELTDAPVPALALLGAVARRQARLIAQWMNLGFIHGVMNTDNMTISGETIDYGPCAFMERYDPATRFSSIDQQGRYAYGNQPAIARWNLARLAEALLPTMVDPDGPEAEIEQAIAQVSEVIDAFPAWYQTALREGQRLKLGLDAPDAALADAWLALLQRGGADFTQAWRALAEAREGNEAALHALFDDSTGLAAWLAHWQAACTATPAQLRAANPRLIPRNHRVEEALAAASEGGDMAPTEALLAALRQPFSVDPALQRYAEPAPAAQAAGYRTFCGT